MPPGEGGLETETKKRIFLEFGEPFTHAHARHTALRALFLSAAAWCEFWSLSRSHSHFWSTLTQSFIDIFGAASRASNFVGPGNSPAVPAVRTTGTHDSRSPECGSRDHAAAATTPTSSRLRLGHFLKRSSEEKVAPAALERKGSFLPGNRNRTLTTLHFAGAPLSRSGSPEPSAWNL